MLNNTHYMDHDVIFSNLINVISWITKKSMNTTI